MKKLGIREIRKALVGKYYKRGHIHEDESRGFVEWRKLEHILTNKIKHVDMVEADPFENADFVYLVTFEDYDAETFYYEPIEELVTKGFIFEEHSYGISGIPTTHSLSWLDEENSNSISIHTIYNYYVQNVMLGTMQTYEFAVKLARKLNVTIEHIYHFIDNSNDFACMLEHFDWEHSDEYQRRTDDFKLD